MSTVRPLIISLHRCLHDTMDRTFLHTMKYYQIIRYCGVLILIIALSTLVLSARTQPPAESVLPSSMHTISTITVSHDKGRRILEKLGTSWKIVYPDYADADQELLQQFITTLNKGTMGKLPFWQTLLEDEEIVTIETRNTTGVSYSFTVLRSNSGHTRIRLKEDAHVYQSEIPLDIFKKIASGEILKKSLLPDDTLLSIDIRNRNGVLKTMGSPQDTESISHDVLLLLLKDMTISELHTRSMGSPFPEELRQNYDYKLYYRYESGLTVTIYILEKEDKTYVYKDGDDMIGIRSSTNIPQALSWLFS